MGGDGDGGDVGPTLFLGSTTEYDSSLAQVVNSGRIVGGTSLFLVTSLFLIVMRVLGLVRGYPPHHFMRLPILLGLS